MKSVSCSLAAITLKPENSDVERSILYPVMALPCADGAVQSKTRLVVADDVIVKPVTCAGTSEATTFAVFDAALVPYVLIAYTF